MAAHSSRLTLGTATLIPYRHPIQTAMQLVSLTRFVPAERLIVAWGTGAGAHHFAAIGASGTRRGALLEEQVEIVRKLATGESISHRGEHYSFDGVRIHPPDGHIRFWYGGGTPRAMRRAISHFDGLLASRIPVSMLAERIALLNQLAEAAGRQKPEVGLVTLVSPGPTIERALAAFDIRCIRAEVEGRFPSRQWDAQSGFDGVLIAGPAERMAEQLAAFEAIGVQHFIVDLRARFDEWESVIEEIAVELLPLVDRKE